MYDQFPNHDVPQNNIIQRFFGQRWSAIALEIVMTIVITIAAGAAFDFFDPLDGEGATATVAAPLEATAVDAAAWRTSDPLAFIKAKGAEYIGERRFAAAVAMFDWAIALAPEDVASYSWRGYANMLAGDYVAAQADYLKLLEMRPADFDGHNALCWAYGESRDFAAAEAHCQLALEYASKRIEFAFALENRCWLKVEMGEYGAAATDCRLSLSYAPEYEEVRALANYNMGRVLLAQGRTDKALPHFQEALRIGSSYSKMYLEISVIYDRLGYRSVAQASFAKYRELAGRGESVALASG